MESGFRIRLGSLLVNRDSGRRTCLFRIMNQLSSRAKCVGALHVGESAEGRT